VTVRLGACGVCHSDLSAVNGTIPFPPPVVLGHEGAPATVVAVGEGVSELRAGRPRCWPASFVSMCGTCRYCHHRPPGNCATMAAKSRLYAARRQRAHVSGTPPASRCQHLFSGCGVMAEYATLHQATTW
jgi:Zn-dependent alcohol dehydrogenase